MLPMIVARIYEGLGNQLFQYAMGRATAARHGSALKLDLTWFDGDQGGAERASARRSYRLDAFHVRAPRATLRDLAYHRPAEAPLGRATSKLLRLGSGRMARQVHERGMQFQPQAIADAGPDAYLNGYWQSERYFAPVADLIREEFRLRDGPDVDHARQQIQAWRRADGGAPLVAVHVRRGDLVPFLLNGKLHKNHGPPTSASFVRAAMSQFPPGCRFVVVADPGDRDWCREHVVGDDVVYYHGPTDIADFAMLQGCDHHVIANSTFSWWAAWLNPNPGKRVIAPNPWFWPDGPAWRTSIDLSPDQWVQLHSDAAEMAAVSQLREPGP
jgi:hypothetical protein